MVTGVPNGRSVSRKTAQEVSKGVVVGPYLSIHALRAALARAYDPVRNFHSLFERPPGALAPLDGLRAWAVLWVIIFRASSSRAAFPARAIGRRLLVARARRLRHSPMRCITITRADSCTQPRVCTVLHELINRAAQCLLRRT